METLNRIVQGIMKKIASYSSPSQSLKIAVFIFFNIIYMHAEEMGSHYKFPHILFAEDKALVNILVL